MKPDQYVFLETALYNTHELPVQETILTHLLIQDEPSYLTQRRISAETLLGRIRIYRNFLQVALEQETQKPTDQTSKDSNTEKNSKDRHTGHPETDSSKTTIPTVNINDATKWIERAGILLGGALSVGAIGLIAYVFWKFGAKVLELLRNVFGSAFDIASASGKYLLAYVTLDLTITALDYAARDAEDMLRRRPLPDITEQVRKHVQEIRQQARKFITLTKDLPGFQQLKTLAQQNKINTNTAFTITDVQDMVLTALLLPQTGTVVTETHQAWEHLPGIALGILFAPRVIEHSQWLLRRISKHENVPFALIVLSLLTVYLTVYTYAILQVGNTLIDFVQHSTFGAIIGTTLLSTLIAITLPSYAKLAYLVYRYTRIVVKHSRHIKQEEWDWVLYAASLAISKHFYSALKEYVRWLKEMFKGK